MRVARTIERVANADVSVMLLGASGTGKELLAAGVHQASRRRAGGFVAINCAAIPENLLEAELFGHEKGAFTGAIKTTEGKIELAHGGTLFLDEVGDIPLPLQVKLLRFLQERVIERIGGRKPIAVDTRIVCATHQNLDEMIAAGTLPRGPLLPARRNRGAHPEPGRAAWRRGAARQAFPRPLRPRDEPAGEGLRARRAGGDRDLALAGQRPRAREPAEARRDHGRRQARSPPRISICRRRDEDSLPVNLKAAREAADRAAIRKALAQTDGNISGAAKLLGISRPTLYDLLKQYDLQP